jgi:hypothetical protein
MVPWIDINELLNYAPDPAHSIIDKNEVWYRLQYAALVFTHLHSSSLFFILLHSSSFFFILLHSSSFFFILLHSSSFFFTHLHYLEGVTLEDLCILCLRGAPTNEYGARTP